MPLNLDVFDGVVVLWCPIGATILQHQEYEAVCTVVRGGNKIGNKNA